MLANFDTKLSRPPTHISPEKDLKYSLLLIRKVAIGIVLRDFRLARYNTHSYAHSGRTTKLVGWTGTLTIGLMQ